MFLDFPWGIEFFDINLSLPYLHINMSLSCRLLKSLKNQPNKDIVGICARSLMDKAFPCEGREWWFDSTRAHTSPPTGGSLQTMTLSTPVSQILRVGPAYEKRLKAMGITQVRDLLFHFPRTYEDFSHITPIAKLEAGNVY